MEEIIKNPLIKDEEEEMIPKPSKDQLLLWEELDKRVPEANIIVWSEGFYTLPINIRDYLASETVSSKIKTIAQDFNLSKEELKNLAKIINTFFGGLINPSNIFDYLKKTLKNLKDEQLKNLLEKTRQEIFLAQRDFLRQTHGIKEEAAKPSVYREAIPEELTEPIKPALPIEKPNTPPIPRAENQDIYKELIEDEPKASGVVFLSDDIKINLKDPERLKRLGKIMIDLADKTIEKKKKKNDILEI